MQSAIGWGICCWVSLALGPQGSRAADGHSYAHPEHVRVRHVHLDLEVDFDRQRLRGQATLTVERTSPDDTQPLILDSRKLQIDKVETSTEGKAFEATSFKVGREDEILGAAVTVRLPAKAKLIRVTYATGPQASGLQWLNRDQTSGKTHPFLFTQ